jgi:hypothetical protein
VLLSLAQAAEATGRSTDHLRRAIRAGKIEATKGGEKGGYQVTPEALLAAGYELKQPETEGPTEKPAQDDTALLVQEPEPTGPGVESAGR